MFALTMLLQATPAQDDPTKALLMQLSIQRKAGETTEARDARVADLQRSVRAITTCASGLVEARRLRAEVTIRYPVSIDTLPAALRDIMTRLPVGRASPVFGGDGVARSLLRCAPEFRDTFIAAAKALKDQEDAKRARRGA